MRKILHIVTYMSLLFLNACDIHEWPESFPPETESRIHLRLNYETDMTKWEHVYVESSVVEQALGETYDNHLEHGKIRYIIRTYPISESKHRIREHIHEFVFTKDIADGYDHEATLDIQPGNYNILIWSDLVESEDDEHFYDAYDFSEIILRSDNQCNNNYRDAFYGKIENISIEPNYDNIIDTIDITMKRPLAKFEIVANDFSTFMRTEPFNFDKSNIASYKVLIQYTGFMPNAYSLFTGKPVDASAGLVMESSLNLLNEDDVSLGFDYVFVSESVSSVTIRIGVYDNEGSQVSLTETIKVPLKANHHTILSGNFLMQNTSGGIDINPDFDGNHNIIVP